MLEYNDGLVVEVFVAISTLGYAEVLAHADHMYHVERGHYSYKLHWLVPGKTLSEGLLYLNDDASVEKMDTGKTYGEFDDIFVE